MRKASAIELDDAQREKLMKLAHSNTAEVRVARRASIVLLAADGLDNHRIGEILGVDRIQVGRWRDRYAAGGLKVIEQDLPRGGRKPKIDAAVRGYQLRPLYDALLAEVRRREEGHTWSASVVLRM